MINTKTYPIQDLFLSKGVVGSLIQKFWNEEYSSIIREGNQKYLMLMVKVHFIEKELGYRTLGHLRKVNFTDKELFINYISERLNILNDSYTSISISEITFTYIIREGEALGTQILLKNLGEKQITNHRFNNLNLPISMNPSDYGKIIVQTLIEEFTRFIVTNNQRTYQIDVSLNKLINRVTILGASDLKWIDTLVSEGCFKREIQKSTIYFLDGEEVLRKQILTAKPFKKLGVDKFLQKYIVTLDLETIRQDNKLIPYLICAYNGTEYITSYADSSLNQKVLFQTFFKKLLTFFKNDNVLNVYAHNFSNFDGIFLLNQLMEYGKLEPLYFNGRLMSIKLKLNIAGYTNKTIVFKDSILLLPASLRVLCEVFKISTVKSYFPYLLSNINYTGVLPEFKYWSGITPAVYDSIKLQFKNKMWSFQIESINYCKLDCKCLHEILTLFNKIFYNKFSINIFSSLTAPALAMRLYKTHFMPENTLYSFHGKIETAIRESYSGGAVDVYKPHNKIGSFTMSRMYRKLKCFDVNSLYPTVMAQQMMPVGIPILFEGNIRRLEPDAYGVFYCKITSPAYLEHPILQKRVKTSDGTRTIAGLGSWEGWITSTEMDNAIKSGYAFEILRGYEFEKANIFKNYIETLYNLRLQYPKGHPMNNLAKLMMNSLYGKFGMRDEFTRVDIYSINSDADKIAFKKLLAIWGTTIKDFVLLESHLIVIRDKTLDLRSSPEGLEEDSYHGVETNIAIASVITAEARIFMSWFKNNPLFHLYYSDTDSIFIDGELPEGMIGKALGQVKLEYIINKAIFLAPKVYALILEDGTEIVKVKGVTPNTLFEDNIHFNDIADLLIQDSKKELNQEKWYKSITRGTITVADVAYTLKATSNKRQAVYVDGIYENTIPYFYDEIGNQSSKDESL